MSFDETTIFTMVDKVVSHAEKLGKFETVHTHEPKSAPGTGMHLALWVQSLMPIHASGLASTSGRVELFARIYTSFIQKSEDAVDPDILGATCALVNAYTSDFDFGATLRMVDLLGAYGQPLQAKAGYLEIDRKMFRVMTLVVPLIYNDMFVQVP